MWQRLYKFDVFRLENGLATVRNPMISTFYKMLEDRLEPIVVKTDIAQNLSREAWLRITEQTIHDTLPDPEQDIGIVDHVYQEHIYELMPYDKWVLWLMELAKNYE